ncbi:MAG: DNA-binding domain-containing protein [bacterium]
MAGLIAALGDAYPVVLRLVGLEFFRAMVATYVNNHPPQSPILLAYGAGFPRFLAIFPPVKSLPYLSDVARIERAWLEAYHAPDQTPAEVTPVLTLPPAILGTVRVNLHPSLRLIASHFPALTIWQSNQPGNTPSPVDLAIGETAMILRPHQEVLVQPLTLGGTAFFAGLQEGDTIMQSAAKGIAQDPAFDFAGNLSALLLSGAVVGWQNAAQTGVEV